MSGPAIPGRFSFRFSRQPSCITVDYTVQARAVEGRPQVTHLEEWRTYSVHVVSVDGFLWPSWLSLLLLLPLVLLLGGREGGTVSWTMGEEVVVLALMPRAFVSAKDEFPCCSRFFCGENSFSQQLLVVCVCGAPT